MGLPAPDDHEENYWKRKEKNLSLFVSNQTIQHSSEDEKLGEESDIFPETMLDVEKPSWLSCRGAEMTRDIEVL